MNDRPVEAFLGLPDYAGLLARTDAPAGSSWGLFGPDDDLGTLNLLTPERAVRAASLVREGTVFNLDLTLDAFDPPVSHRSAPEHKIFGAAEYHRDDTLDGFYLQGSTQVDSLRHMKHPRFGFYNATPDEQVAVGKSALGVGSMADHGIVGRGVLIDVETFLRQDGRPLDHASGAGFDIADVQAAAESQGVTREPGDVVLVRTGWIAYVLGLDPAERETRAKSPAHSSGLLQSREALAWLWDTRTALFACDNLAVEKIPTSLESPFRTDPDLSALQGLHTGMMHPVILGLLGMPLGELWWLDDLAAACRQDGRWDFMLTAHLLNLVGGVGSPANAYAIR